VEVLAIESIERGNEDQMKAFMESFDDRMRELVQSRLGRGAGDDPQTR
jgi:hypothetical protein